MSVPRSETCNCLHELGHYQGFGVCCYVLTEGSTSMVTMVSYNNTYLR